jgi:tRNA (guanine37-N1)-methyltransferase
LDIDVFTLFPEAFGWFEGQRHVANALAHGHRLAYVNYRDHTPLTGGQVDDTPFGGGAGMVLRVDVVEAAMRARYGLDPVELRRQRRVIALTPSGRLLDDALVDELANEPALTLLSGRYEGFDERVLEHFTGQEVSIGRYVLAGGELPAMVLCDAVLRKLPGALATSTRPTRNPSAGRSTARQSIRTTPGRPSTEAGVFRRCCYRATTLGSASGAGSRAARGRSRIRPAAATFHLPTPGSTASTL